MNFPTEEYRLLMKRLVESRKALRPGENRKRIAETGQVDIEGVLIDLLDAAILALSSSAISNGGSGK